MENLPQLMSAVQDIAKYSPTGEQSYRDFCLAVEEACVNIIRHAYAGTEVGLIDFDLSLSDDNGLPAFVCTLRDQGVRFDPLRHPLPDTRLSADERDIGGLGVLLMRQLSDRLIWTFDENIGNCLTLIKYRSS
jgi:serine/threonine-protein kinase RsbW